MISLLQNNLPVPDQTLDVYGINDLNTSSRIKKEASNRLQKNTDRSVKNEGKAELKLKAHKTKEIAEESPPKETINFTPVKTHLHVADPQNINIEAIDPSQSVEFRRIEKVMDEKLQNHQRIANNTDQNLEVTEEDVGKILQNYKEDMDLTYLVTIRVMKLMGKTLSSTNKIFNKCVEIEQDCLKAEKDQIEMGDKINKIEELLIKQ